MSWLYLAVSLWGAWFTWNALRPSHAPAQFATVSFAAGWLTSELALHHIGWQAVATVAFWAAGAFEAWPGRVGLAITVASWAGLALVQRRAGAASEVVERALRDGLGADYRGAIEPGLLSDATERVDLARALQPHRIRRPGVEVTKNVRYGRERAVDLHLDVYRRSDHPTGCPVLFQIHGGAWVIGSKDQQALPLMYQLAESGWVCVSANYRLSPAATFPDHLLDCKRALAWVKRNVAEYGGDPGFVAVTGGSAGGHLAALVALTANDPSVQPGFEDVDTRVQACVPFYGVYDFTNRNRTYAHDGLVEFLEKRVMKGSPEEIPEAWEAASPIARIHEEAPPFFVIHGESDTLVPVAEARGFVRALGEKTRAPLAYAEVPGAQHAFEIFPSVRTAGVVNGVHRFLAWVYSAHLRDRESAAA